MYIRVEIQPTSRSVDVLSQLRALAFAIIPHILAFAISVSKKCSKHGSSSFSVAQWRIDRGSDVNVSFAMACVFERRLLGEICLSDDEKPAVDADRAYIISKLVLVSRCPLRISKRVSRGGDIISETIERDLASTDFFISSCRDLFAASAHAPIIMFAHTLRQRLPHCLQRTHVSRLHTNPPLRRNKFSAYTERLTALATRTGVSLPSLALSFGILHELTALIPLVGFFFAFQAADVGTGIVRWAGEVSADDEGTRWRSKVRDWLGEGERRVDRVARKYGMFGYASGTAPGVASVEEGEIVEEARQLVGRADRGSKAAADVTNAIAAYVLVKVRICGLFVVVAHVSTVGSVTGAHRSFSSIRSGVLTASRRSNTALRLAWAFERTEECINVITSIFMHGLSIIHGGEYAFADTAHREP
jgi:hypothetical protein